MLPDSMAPFKHYEESTISKVLDGEITEEKNDVPSPQTMRRWAVWLVMNKNQIEAVIRSCGYKVFDYQECADHYDFSIDDGIHNPVAPKLDPVIIIPFSPDSFYIHFFRVFSDQELFNRVLILLTNILVGLQKFVSSLRVLYFIA
jgi:hypothetical protein